MVTYCGGYCGYCARWVENLILADLASVIAGLVDAHGFQHWMPSEVKEFDYKEFRKALDFFSKKNSWLICLKGCKQGDGNPYCEIRDCCKRHEISLCFECGKFPCDMVKDDKKIMERAREYKNLGKEEWLQQQIRKAKNRYEDHTRKYYSNTISKAWNDKLNIRARDK